MSVFASHTTTTIAVPHDPPQTVTIRKLRGRELQDAQAADLRAFIGNRSPRGWAGTLRGLIAKARAGDDVGNADPVLTDPLIGYDRAVVVRAALLSWTYTDHPPTADEIDDLDDETIDFIAREILRLTKPQLFTDPGGVQREVAAPVPGANGAGAVSA